MRYGRAPGHETSFEGIDTSGSLDRDLIRLLLGGLGAKVRDIEGWLPAIIEKAQSQYELICPELQDRVCPGVRGFLERLQAEDIPAGLVTGNLTAIGWKKMDAAGLRSFFGFGAFADMARTRAGLARIAIREAKRQGLAAQITPISLVGDHPNEFRLLN